MRDLCSRRFIDPVRGLMVGLGILLGFLVAFSQGAAIAAKLPPIKGEEILARNLWRTPVSYRTEYPPGSIIVDTSERHLYFIVGPGTALRYGIAVGREGKQWEGGSPER